jgi:hypothetical protein
VCQCAVSAATIDATGDGWNASMNSRAPLLKGLDDDACHGPHWGFIVSGELVVTYTNGDDETCVGDDLFFYWPPGHSVRVVKDAEVILFSPQDEHGEVMDHMLATMAG